MPYEIKYANNVTWRQTAEADTGWERPDQIETLTGSGVVLWSTGDYGYDGVGNISKIGTRAYTYDSFSRLEAVKVSGQPTAEQQATYDSYGNLVNLHKNGVARILTANVATNRLATADTVYTSNNAGVKNVEILPPGSSRLSSESSSKTVKLEFTAVEIKARSGEAVFGMTPPSSDSGQVSTFLVQGLGTEAIVNFSINIGSHEAGHASGALDRYSGDGFPLGSHLFPKNGEAGSVMEQGAPLDVLTKKIREFSNEDAVMLRDVLNLEGQQQK